MVTGHVADKVDLIIMGGTFTARDKAYQDDFIMYSLKAMNDFSEQFFVDAEFDIDVFKEFFELPGNIHEPKRTKHIQEKILKLKGESDLLTEQKRNETTVVRCIGMTIETRPDWGFVQHANSMLEQGATRIELGVQSVYDNALLAIQRGHSVADNKRSIQELKDLGFKLNFHMMLGLPSGKTQDDFDSSSKAWKRLSHQEEINGLKDLFIDPDYQPDMLKIYPLMVMPGTLLQKDYDEGLFIPISTSESAEIIAEFLPQVEPYCRVMRVQRDIPTYKIIAGVNRTNLRQYVDDIMKQKGVESRDIRARETGRKEQKEKPSFSLLVQEYESSGGKEFFISMEDTANDAIAGFCRLRFPGKQLRKEITPTTAIIRELHVYGTAVGIGETDDSSSQHKGFGKKLIAKAEVIAREHAYTKMLVISGIGVKEYYRMLGYTDDGPYLGKQV
jgi:elongator complex protein 3